MFKKLNGRQKILLRSWHRSLWDFAKREWLPFFLWSGLGVFTGEVVDALLRDRAFRHYLVVNYRPSVSFDNPEHYVPYLAVILGTILLSIIAYLCVYLWRGMKSWWAGVTSGLILLPFVSALLLSVVRPSRIPDRLLLGCMAGLLWFSFGFALYFKARIHSQRAMEESEFVVPSSIKSVAGSTSEWTDDPIQTWAQDTLGRAAVVDSISIKLMIAKAPAILLSGPFGSGKTSTLNLLREHLGNKAITISFSTWLPGSQETLTSYLLADIANECKKHYIVPGLRQSARRMATALGQKVPLLSGYLKLLPPSTQKDDIASLKSALLRLPKRVAVLLDEIDRMEKDEIITLLKVIRGIATLPNLSFVCAGNLETLIKVTEKDNEYFERFFPVVISISEPDAGSLRRTGVDRLVAVFASCGWFERKDEAESVKREIERVWDGRIAPFCRTLRAVGLLANDVSVAAAPLRREVDPVDLTLIEMLQRFKPAVHKLLAKNSVALTGGETLLRSGTYHTDEEEGKARTTLLEEVRAMSNDQEGLSV